MSDVLRGKVVSKRSLFRSFQEDPLACLLEWILSDAFELEKGTRWFDLLKEAEEIQDKGELADAVDILLAAMSKGIAIGVLFEDGDVLRIPDEKYQMAMDIAGIWYDPYTRSTDEDAYRISDKGAAMMDEYGAEGVIRMLAKDLEEKIKAENRKRHKGTRE